MQIEVNRTFAQMFLSMYSVCCSEGISHFGKNWDLKAIATIEKQIIDEIQVKFPDLYEEYKWCLN